MKDKAILTWQYITDNVLRDTLIWKVQMKEQLSTNHVRQYPSEMRRDVRYESWHLNNRNACVVQADSRLPSVSVVMLTVLKFSF
jgi:hypothetical protein